MAKSTEAGRDVVDFDAALAYFHGRYDIFEALDALEFDGKVSGNASWRWYARDELAEGIRRLIAREPDAAEGMHVREPSIRFLRECLAAFPSDDERICFWFC